MDYTKAINDYLAKGLKVIPLDGKSPRDKDWQHRSFSAEEILAKLATYAEPAIGIQMGPKSGIIDFEYDSPAQHQKIIELMGGVMPPCVSFRSTHGGHFIFAWDERLEATNAGNLTIPCDNGEKLIVRIGAAGKGSQSAFPPSPGKLWATNPSKPRQTVGSIFEINPPKLMGSAIEKLLTYSQPAPTAVTPDPETEASPERLGACREALAKLPDAVEGDSGGGRTINAACEIRRHRIYGEQGLALLQEFNDEKCFPPWDDRELQRKWEEAKKFEPAAEAEFDFFEEEESPPPAKPKAREATEYRLISSRELAAEEFKTSYAIIDALVEGQPLIVAGPQKSLKTSTLIDASVALAIGGYFLGRLRVTRPYRTLLMSGESGLATLKETAERICVTAKTELAKLDNLIWSPDLPKFGDPTHATALRAVLKANSVEMLVVEPAYLCMPGGDAGNLFTQGAMLADMSSLCQELGVTLILAHHTKKVNDKRNTYQALGLTDIAWAGFQEFARQWWMLSRRERYEEGSGRHRLWLAIGGSAGHSSVWGVDINEGVKSEFEERYWETEVFPGGLAKERDGQRGLDSDAEKVLAYLRTAESGDTESGIRGGARLSHHKAKQAVTDLIQKGEIAVCDINRAGRKYQGFRVKNLISLTSLTSPTCSD